MSRIAIVGAGGHGKVVADIAVELGWQDICFFDKAWPEKKNNGSWDVIGNTEILLNTLEKFKEVFVAIGNNAIRQKTVELLIRQELSIATLIHSRAYVSRGATVDAGSVMMANAVVNIDAKVGKGCIINTGATVDHDCLLENYVHIGPGANLGGNVTVREGAWVGIGASVRQGIIIGKNSIVGAGAVVVKDVPDNVTVVGNPAKPMAIKDKS